MDKMDNGHFVFLMQNDVFFIIKRTLRLQRKSVKIAEKVQRAPIFLHKGLADRPLDVVTLQLERPSPALPVEGGGKASPPTPLPRARGVDRELKGS